MFVSALSVAAFSVSIYGWGRALYWLCYGQRPSEHAFAAGLGIAALTFLGGLLNAAGLAGATTQAVVGYLGIAFAILFLAMTFFAARPSFGAMPVAGLIFFAGIVATGIFLIANLLPARALNYADDFQTYLPRIVRMRETGTITGNPFDLLGLAGFGGDTFLQGISLTWLPLVSVTAFDTIVCFLLAMLLLAEIGSRYGAARWMVALAIAVCVVINPMIVNISPVYSTVVLVLCLVRAAAVMVEDQTATAGRRIACAAPVALLASALVVFKTTGVFFAAPLVFIVLAGGVTFALLRWDSAIAVVALGAISSFPWLAMQADKVPSLLRAKSIEIPADPALTIPWSFAEAFRDRATIYGSSRVHYVCAVLAVIALVLASALALARRRDPKANLPLFAAGIAGLFAYVLTAGFVNNEAALRYTAPFLIALAPMLVLQTALQSGFTPVMRKAALAASLVLSLGSIVAFAPAAQLRLQRAVNQHTLNSYPIDDKQFAWQAAVLSEPSRQRTRALQAQIPAGATVFAWAELPFFMDYARNRIVQFNAAFFVSPWRLDATSAEAVKAQLRAHGVEYVLVQYGSRAAIPEASQEMLAQKMWPEDRAIFGGSMTLLKLLIELSKSERLVFARDGIALIALGRT